MYAAPFNWDGNANVRGLRVGVLQSAFDAQQASKPFDTAALAVIAGLGVTLVPVTIPELPYDAMRIILSAEAGAVVAAAVMTAAVQAGQLLGQRLRQGNNRQKTAQAMQAKLMAMFGEAV